MNYNRKPAEIRSSLKTRFLSLAGKLFKSIKLTDNTNFIGFDKYQKNGAYHWTSISEDLEYKAIADSLLRIVSNVNYTRLLDVGCGDGALAGYLASNLQISSILGIDADKTAIKVGQEMLVSHQINNVSLKKATITEAYRLTTANSFDVIYSMDVIEHLPDPYQLIEFIDSRLKTNGCGIIGTPLFISKELQSKYHIVEFSEEDMRNMLIKQNLKNTTILGGQRKNKKYYTRNYIICVFQKQISH